jgi:hypothetical protein
MLNFVGISQGIDVGILLGKTQGFIEVIHYRLLDILMKFSLGGNKKFNVQMSEIGGHNSPMRSTHVINTGLNC